MPELVEIKPSETKPKVWAIVTGSDGVPCVYHIGAYDFTQDRMLFLWDKSPEDEYPLTIVNLSYSGSVDFMKEQPKMMTIDDFNKEAEEAKGGKDGSL